ncbi:Methyl-accepting chemotaxis protein NahY [Saliniradius amylolyticus]|uniref:Methyl-accepting chemotaxis protein NahY n=1 Tax=Saliniradius amylolyticus TaxID=2183582 RepID=A0A2S2E662_9ALTE|nr:methyl-accepting chemotaxis protein [Saliniradius amylolyticus]AWL13123.1 Methyl-accepting chemotaxis protein NahY [Saliniradius amylolyticus]
MFKNMKVAVRLALMASVLTALLIIAGLMGIIGMKGEHDAMTTVYKDRVVPLRDLKTIADMYAVNIVDTAHKVRNGGMSWDKGADNVEQARDVIQQRWSAYLATQLVSEEQRLVNEIKPLLRDADDAVNDLLRMFENRNEIALESFVLNRLYPVIEPVSDRFSALVEVQLKVAEQEYNDSAASYTTSMTINIILIAVSIIVSIVLSVIITRSLVKQLGGEPAYAERVVNAVANGDLTVKIDLNPGDNSSMLAAINRMVEKLSDIIAQVRASADNLSSASEQMSATSQSISQAASEQASSVEETSASMEEMSASINQNNENSKVTDGIANKSAQDAIKGGEAVKETVSAMRQIADKISIIDDIAYQTNLLALNAAIEAGRAGEHGRGFAVVAAEVRKLAARSQTAAQEIGEVATSSVGLAEDAGKLLEEIVPSIQKTAELVQEIAAASSEQATGAEEINSAIGQITNATQQNAASSEELSSTSEELTGQAVELQEMMEFFQVDSNKLNTRSRSSSYVKRPSAGKSSRTEDKAAGSNQNQSAGKQTQASKDDDFDFENF